MDIQTMFDNAVIAARDKVLKTSPQLTVIELIMKLETAPDKNLPVYFDGDDARPGELRSWRGSYRELAFEYELEGDAPTVAAVLSELHGSLGKTYEGYKGGDFLMGKHTPLWVSHWGESGKRGVVGVTLDTNKVTILTNDVEY